MTVTERPEVVLTEAPSLVKLFAGAVLTSRLPKAATLPDTEVVLRGATVDRAHLSAYQRVCGFGIGDVLPHTYVHLMGFPLQGWLMSQRSFPMPLAGLVHLENVITVRRVLTAGETYDLAVHAENLRAHPKGRVVDLITRVSVGGETVAEGVSSYLQRGRGEADAVSSRPPAFPDGVASARLRLPEGLGREYAAISGDVNPIHLYPLTAKAMGFPRQIAHGMWTYARTIAALGKRAEGPVTSHIWFKKPVFLPSTVELLVGAAADDPRGILTGMRSAKQPDTEHLVMTVTPTT